MALLITRQVTLTEKNDSGPFFDVYYSPDCITYYLSPNGENVYLPTIGSSVNVQVASTTSCIKLVSTGQCINELISGSTTTTTTSTTSTTTTTTTAPPFSVYKIQRDGANPVEVTYTDPYDQSRSRSWSSGVPLYIIAKSIDSTLNASVTNLGSETEPFRVEDTGSIINEEGYLTTGSISSLEFMHGYYLDFNTKTAEYFDVISSGPATWSECMISGSLMIPATSLTGLTVNYGFGALCGTTTTTTSTTTTTTAPQVTQIWSDTLPGFGNLQSCGCTGETGVYNYQFLGNNVNIYQDLTGETLYQDWDTNTLFVGDDLWYCITDAENTETTISIRVNNFGVVTDWVDCTTTTTTTTSTTTTTTTSATGCYEYLLECLDVNDCLVTYTDCDGNPQSFTQQYDTGGIICARPTPNISGGTVEFLGDCGITTTTTTSTTTTTTTASPGSQYGTHTLFIPGGSPGTGTLVWSGFNSNALQWITDATGISSPSSGTSYTISASSIDVYYGSGVFADTINIGGSSTAKWEFDGFQTTITLTSVATLTSSLNGSDNFRYIFN